MKIFVTGATGFIGSQVANILICQGHELVCLIRKHNHKSAALADLGAKLVMGDLCDKKSLMEGMNGCDAAINIAAVYEMWLRDNRLYRDVNVNGTRNIMECVLEKRLNKVVHVSSAIVFGKPKDTPFTEDSVPGPDKVSRYAKSKYEGDQIVWDLYRNKGLPVVVIYPNVVVGGGDPKASGNYISNFIHKRLPGQVLLKSSMTWVHVKDVAEGITKALHRKDNIGEKYLIGKEVLSFAELNKMISEVSGVPLPKITIPDFLILFSAFLLTGLSRITGREPMLGMSVDQIRTMKNGIVDKGTKAERELGLVYTPVRKAIEEEVSIALGEYMQSIKKQVHQSSREAL